MHHLLSIDYPLKNVNNPMNVYALKNNQKLFVFCIKSIAYLLPVNVYNKLPVLVSYKRTFVSFAADAKYRSSFEIANARIRP
jgi:hypothetical protein